MGMSKKVKLFDGFKKKDSMNMNINPMMMNNMNHMMMNNINPMM